MNATIVDTFTNPGIHEATLTAKNMPGLCALIDERCMFDVKLEYAPAEECVTIEWFAATVKELNASPITAEGLAVALRDAVGDICDPLDIVVTVCHHEKDGVLLTVTA
jgi:hypothetical protein